MSVTSLKDRFPIRAHSMALACRKLAEDLRSEHAMGRPPIQATGSTGGAAHRVPLDVAARSMETQAERWEHECATGEINAYDRIRMDADFASNHRSPLYKDRGY